MATTDRWQRLAPLAGVVAIVLLVLGVSIAGEPGPTDPAADAVEYFVDDGGKALGGMQIIVLGIFSFLWFVGTLASALRAREGDPGRLAAIAFGGGVAGGALMLASAAMTVAGALRGDENGSVGGEYASLLVDVHWILIGFAAPIGFAVLAAATAILSLRTGWLPSWFAYLTLLMALGLVIGAVSYIVIMVFFLWVVVVSVILYQRGAAPTGVAPPT